MSDPKPVPRPRQVSLLAWTIMGGSALVVVMVFSMIGNLHSLDTRTAVEKFLAEPPVDGLGLTVNEAIAGMRVLGMVAAACATATGILGYFVLKPHRQARLALAVLAAPLMISGTVAGGFLSAVVAAASVMLWLSPAREWFAGKPLPTPGPRTPVGVTAGAPPPERAVEQPQTPAPYAEQPPPATTPFGVAPPTPAYGQTDPAPGTRPVPVLLACLLTWLFAGLGTLAGIGAIAYLAADPDAILAEFHKQNPDLAAQGVTDGMLLAATYMLGGMFVLWSLAALVLAALVWRGVAWARIVLLVSTVGAVGLCLIGTVSSVAFLGPLVGALVTVSFLTRPEAARWVHRR